MEIYHRGDLQENLWNSQAQENKLGQKTQIMSSPRDEGEILVSLGCAPALLTIIV